MKQPSKIDFNPFPVLETERIILRRIVPADANDFFLVRSNPEVMRALDKHPFEHKDEITTFMKLIETDISSGKGIRWGLCLKTNNVLIGCFGFHKINTQSQVAEIGYELLPQFHNLGIASEAIKKVVDFGFKFLSFTKIEAGVNPENAISIKLLTKHGFTKSHSTVGDYYFDGRFLNSDYYSLPNPYS